jgi:hypothetical protein
MLVAKFFASRLNEVPRRLVTKLEQRLGLQTVVTWITRVTPIVSLTLKLRHSDTTWLKTMPQPSLLIFYLPIWLYWALGFFLICASVGGGLPAFQIYICSEKKYKGLIKGVYIHNSNCKWGSVHNTDSRKPRVYNTFAERMRRRPVKSR